MFAAM